MGKTAYVYILTSQRNGTLYVGVTSDLQKRVWQHREGELEGFSKKHGLKMLAWFEVHDDIVDAIAREKAIKKWRRKWKLELIEKTNPEWRDLCDEISGFPLSRE